MIVWLLGKLSLLLGVALLVVIVLFTLDLSTQQRRVEPLANEAAATVIPSPLPVHESSSPSESQHNHERSGIGISDTVLTDLPSLPYAVPSNSTATSSAPQGVNGPIIEESQAPAHPARELPELQYDSVSPATPVQAFAVAAHAAKEAELPADTGPATAPEVVAETEVEASATATVEEPVKAPAVVTPTPTPDPEARPVQIRIPAIKVKRSIIGLPKIRDKKTGSWTQDLDVLFRKGRKDLVGHYEQSAQPGQEGNTILVGHNYGYGTKGVFLKLKRLKPGKRIEVVNAAGQAFAYRVKSVHKVPWKSKGTDELLQHARLLSLSGAERLTLVTCGGSRVQPFPARLYVVAEPIRD
jgi:LPXTG-site transpeptidase (sortase) family protein